MGSKKKINAAAVKLKANLLVVLESVTPGTYFPADDYYESLREDEKQAVQDKINKLPRANGPYRYTGTRF